MNLEILYYLLFFFGFLVTLFTLFSLSKNDFVLLRRGVTLRHVFDVIFVSFIPAFFFSRLFFILKTFSFSIFNPIQFLHIFLYPGLSMMGFFFGMLIYVIYFFSKKKAFLRTFDLYCVSLFPPFLAYLIFAIFEYEHDIERIAHIFFSLLVFLLLIRSYRHFSIKDGNGGIIAMLFISSSLTISSFDTERVLVFNTFSFIEYFGFVIILFSVFLFIYNQFIRKN